MAGKPPLDLVVEVTDADGRVHQWGPSASHAGDVPKAVSFTTKRGDGFSTFNCSLSRRIDQDYVDLGLFREVVVTTTAGDVVWEGRINSIPRSLSTVHEVAVSAVGWMSHAKDRKFSEVYVDRDLSKWQPTSTANRVSFAAAGFNPLDPTTIPDDTTGQPSLQQHAEGPWSASGKPANIARYASAVPLGAIYYAVKANANFNTADTNWSVDVTLGNDDLDTGGTYDTSGNIRASIPVVTALGATTSTRKFARVAAYYNTGPIGNEGVPYDVFWTLLAVYGTHGLTRRGSQTSTSSYGFYSSDVISNIVARWCPQLNTDGVEQTTFVNEQIVFDRAYPYDAFTELNRPHLWNLSVFENKTLYYRPTDLTDYDWEVRLSDPGVTVSLQGDDTASLANGIAVTYTDVTDGKTKTIDPDSTPALADSDPSNPANIAGYSVWTEITISSPVTTAMATQFGIAALAEFNQPKAPGSIKVTGYIRDRAGHWQPVSKVRNDDRVCITDHPNSRNRLIVETDYNHDSHELTMAVDGTFQRIEAVLDRLQTAVSNAGLA